MKPPFRYYGGKGRAAPKIIAMFTPHISYVEPFFGAGAVLFRKGRSRHEVINDRDGMVTNFFRVLRDDHEALVHKLRLTPYSRDEFNWCKANYDAEADPVERARMFFTVVNQSFACTTGSASGWSASTAANVNRAKSTQHYVDRLYAVAERLIHVMIENKPAVELIRGPIVRPDSLVYCDPPYVHATRGNDSDTSGHGYRFEMSDDDHRELAECLHECEATVLLSGYHSDLYDELYADWDHREWPAKSTVAGINLSENPDRNIDRTEVVWSNRPIRSGRLFELDA